MRKRVLVLLLIVIVLVIGYSAMAQMSGEKSPSFMHERVGLLGFHIPFWPFLMFSAIGFGAGAVAYYFVFPEISPRVQLKASGVSDPIDAVMRVLEPDERKAVETLREMGGKMFQRELARKTGYTRVKTHRVVARLASRGVISVRKLGLGKTNEIIMSPWLCQKWKR